MAQSAFQTLSGTIHCRIEPGRLRFDSLVSSSIRPPPPREVEYGDFVGLGGKRPARLIGHGYTIADRAAPALGHGQTGMALG